MFDDIFFIKGGNDNLENINMNFNNNNNMNTIIDINNYAQKSLNFLINNNII